MSRSLDICQSMSVLQIYILDNLAVCSLKGMEVACHCS